jgi:hypothetical protein
MSDFTSRITKFNPSIDSAAEQLEHIARIRRVLTVVPDGQRLTVPLLMMDGRTNNKTNDDLWAAYAEMKARLSDAWRQPATLRSPMGPFDTRQRSENDGDDCDDSSDDERNENEDRLDPTGRYELTPSERARQAYILQQTNAWQLPSRRRRRRAGLDSSNDSSRDDPRSASGGDRDNSRADSSNDGRGDSNNDRDAADRRANERRDAANAAYVERIANAWRQP